MTESNKNSWTQSIMTASATVAMITGAGTIYYFMFPPPEPPPLCFEYRLRQTELDATSARYRIEGTSLEHLAGDLSNEHEAIERVIGRYSDLRRWEALMSLAAKLSDGLNKSYNEIVASFGPEDPDYINWTHPGKLLAWQNLLSTAGWPPGLWPRATLKYWMDDYTEYKLETPNFMAGPKNKNDVDRWLEFLNDVENNAYLKYDEIIRDTRTVPDKLGQLLEINQRTSLYETGIVDDVLQRLRERRSAVESRQYEVDRDIFRIDVDLQNIEAELERISLLSDEADCANNTE